MNLKRLGLTTLFTLLTSLTLTDSFTFLFWKRLQIGDIVLAQTPKEQKAQAERLLNQGLQQAQTSQYPAAIQSWENELNIAHEIVDRNAQANVLGKFFQEYLTVYRQFGNRKNKGDSLINLALVYFNLGEYEKAIELFQESLSIYRKLGDYNAEAVSLLYLAMLYEGLGEYQKAIEFYQQCLTVYREANDLKGEGDILYILGLVYDDFGEYQKAIEFYQQSLTIFREIGDRNSEAVSLFYLGLAYHNLGEYQKAIEFYQQSSTLYPEVGDRQGEGDSLYNSGLVYLKLGEYQKSIEFYQQSLTIFREIGDRQGEGDSLYSLGFAYLHLGEYKKAIELLQQSLNVAPEIGDRNTEKNSLYGLGLAYSNLGEYQKAVEFFQQSLTLSREIGDNGGEGDSLLELGVAYSGLGEHQKAVEFFQQSLTLSREIGDRNTEWEILDHLGKAYSQLREYQKAIEFFEELLTLSREIGNREGEGYSLHELGFAYDDLGEYEKAIEFFQKSLNVAREIGNRDAEGLSSFYLGLSYHKLGQYQQAIEFFLESATIYRELGIQTGEWKVLISLGNLHHDLKEYEKSIQFYQQSLTLAQRLGNDKGKLFSLRNLSMAYFSVEEYQKAIEFLQQSLTTSREIGDQYEERFDLHNLGNAYLDLGEYQKAIEFYQQSLTITREIGDRNDEGPSLNNLGLAYFYLGEYQKAIEFYQQSLTIAREIGDRKREGISLHNLGWAMFKLSNFPEAEKHLLSSLEVGESLKQSIQDDPNKVSLFETQRNTYNSLQKVLIAQNKTHQALEVSEGGRSRSLAELLSQQLAPNSGQFSPVVSLTQLQQIARQQNATIVEYSRVTDTFFLEGKQQAKESELYIWVIKPTGEVEFRRADLKPLWQQQNTSLGGLIFAARCFNNDACKSDFIVASASSNPSRSTLGGSSLFNAQSNLQEEAIQNTSINPPQYRELQQLYQLLIKPIEDLLPTNPDERVIFIPTDSLFYLPFAALQNEQGKFLIEKHTILTSPSISLLESTHKQRQSLSSAAKDLVIVGNPQMPKVALSPGEEPRPLAPLPNAEKEAIEIAKLFKTSALIGENATESTVVQRMANARIIHFATHGIFDNLQPLNSSVALTPSGSEDGLLTANEIFDLKLNAELVVLSACKTGLGQLTGEGMIGLSRSFLSAGVPSLVVSLWSVDDQRTAQLMTQFYQNLQTTPDKAQALRQAMLTIKNQSPDPYYWAAFTLIGEAQ